MWLGPHDATGVHIECEGHILGVDEDDDAVRGRRGGRGYEIALASYILASQLHPSRHKRSGIRDISM